MKIGFIGAGNMGSAIIKGILKSGMIAPENILISRKHPENISEFAEMGIKTLSSNVQLVKSTDIIVMAVKPVYAKEIFNEIHDTITGKFLISIMAGWNSTMLEEVLGSTVRYVCVMPNTPLSVGEGMTLINDHYRCTKDELDLTKKIFSSAGKVMVVEDRYYTAANGISGCGPAFVFEFIESLADGAVRYGVPRKIAYQLAAQTLLGASKMVLETGLHPGILKDAVCSPGGTTIEGVYALEKNGMRAAVMEAIGATVEKTNRMTK